MDNYGTQICSLFHYYDTFRDNSSGVTTVLSRPITGKFCPISATCFIFRLPVPVGVWLRFEAFPIETRRNLQIVLAEHSEIQRTTANLIDIGKNVVPDEGEKDQCAKSPHPFPNLFAKIEAYEHSVLDWRFAIWYSCLELGRVLFGWDTLLKKDNIRWLLSS